MITDVLSHSAKQQTSLSLRLGGQVQGVGFRPFVYRLATQLGLSGWVRNDGAQVSIQLCGDVQRIQQFIERVISDAPAIAKPILLEQQSTPTTTYSDFSIKPSLANDTRNVHLPVDYHTCPDCLAELNDPTDRRYQYPFINCTQCGPRYTLITALPYDRRNTSMATFTLCPACQAEYENPINRRFHAEPVACPVCGPTLSYQHQEQNINDSGEALVAAVAALLSGEIIALKGIGGYHLCCDALNPQAIQNLRARKARPDKPLAVMFAEQGDDGLGMLREYLHIDEVSAQALRAPARPIVLLPMKIDTLPPALAPQLDEIGAMLPYSPLHHLLLRKLARPMVATSANLSGEPVLTQRQDVETRLRNVTQYFLHHNRPIVRPADDSLLRIIAAKSRPLRLGRGLAPLELNLPCKLGQPVLACGGHMKNSVALAWDDRIVISPHIGDLDSPRSQSVFQQVTEDLQHIYQVNAQHLVCDAHSGYSSSRWAKQQSLPSSGIFHHHAHASVLAGEYPEVKSWLVFTWDGVGYGEDGSLWGGEGLYGRPGEWQRLCSWRPFYLPGGDQVARQPWRSAAALCWETGAQFEQAPEQSALLHQAWQQRINTAKSSAVGRLFDAAAAFTGICSRASYEGQAPMWLEHAASQGQAEQILLPLSQDDEGVWRSDWQPLLSMLQDNTRSVADRAHSFHKSVACALVDQACAVRDAQREFAVGICGGVFQNKILTEMVYQQLSQRGFNVFIPENIPMNDGGLCYGQVIEYAARVANSG